MLRAAGSDEEAFTAAWGEWVKDLLLKTLRDAKIELLDEWTAAVRYVLSGSHPQVRSLPSSAPIRYGPRPLGPPLRASSASPRR
jgi:hypothetical protein